jgi:hypothetical protein
MKFLVKEKSNQNENTLRYPKQITPPDTDTLLKLRPCIWDTS